MKDFKILLVEGEDDWQKILQEDIQQAVSELDLGKKSVDLITKETVDEGWKTLDQEGSLDLMVTDLVLPSPSGMSEMELVKQAYQLGIPTIVINEGKSSQDIWDDLFKNQILDVFSKEDYYNNIDKFILKVKHILTKEDRIIRLTPEEIQRQEFDNIWSKAQSALEENSLESFQIETDKLTTLLCQKLGLSLLEDTVTLDQLYGRMIDASNPAFSLNIRRRFPIIYAFHSYTDCDKDDIRKIVALLQNFKIYAHYFALLVVFNQEKNLHQLVHESAYRNDLIVLDYNRVWNIIAAASPLQKLTEYILEQIDLVTVSPYTWAGPVKKSMFFGREDELKTITENISRNNYAILANRKMGKTSLLNRIFPHLDQDPSKQVFNCDLQVVNDYESFYDDLALSFPDLEGEIAKFSKPSPRDFLQVIRNLKQRNDYREIIFIFDEVDELLAYDLDTKERLFKTFRNLSQSENDNVHFIFSGTTTLVKRMLNPDSPLFNFCQGIKIKLLEEKSARDLVTIPMGNIGVKFENEEASVQRILGITARHPNLIQYLCDLLIKKINKKQERTIREGDVESAINSDDFYQYCETLIWGQCKAIDKLIVYLMWSYPQFTESDVIEEFMRRKLDPEGVKKSLETLQIYSTLSKKNGNGTYSFTFPEFAKLMEKRSNIETLSQSYLQEVGLT
ncbi:MAG: ATP-binding protein [Xenococcaceae cyanobacterium]